MTPKCQSQLLFGKANHQDVLRNTEKSYNLGQNNCRLFHNLAQFLFTTSKTELEYYHQKVNVRVALRAAERFKTYYLRKLKNFNKIHKMFVFDGEYTTIHSKAEF